MSWNWSFGDGNSSTSRNPLHIYQVNDTYTVSLEVTNAAGSNTVIRADYITVSASPRVTPTPVSGDSDSTRFVPSTSASTESIVKAGERITVPFPGNLQADESVPVVVTGISIVPSIDIQGVMVSAVHATTGSTTTISGYPPAYYLDISLHWVREDAVREGDIRFSVDEGWLKEQGIAPADLVMTRYHDNGWNELPTRMEQYSNGRYYYAATTPGFSYFAVTRKAGSPTTTTTLVSRVTITQQIQSEFTTGTTTGTVAPVLRTKPVTATTTVPPVGTGNITGVSRNLDHFRCSWNHRLCPYDYLCPALVDPEAEPGTLPEIRIRRESPGGKFVVRVARLLYFSVLERLLIHPRIFDNASGHQFRTYKKNFSEKDKYLF